nr:oligopeptide/dipeptide ABC transporter ATP-binding protein [Ensifer sp. SSB1]
MPSPTNPPSGCLFRTRCPLAVKDCAAAEPHLTEVSSNYRAACKFAGELFARRLTAA